MFPSAEIYRVLQIKEQGGEIFVTPNIRLVCSLFFSLQELDLHLPEHQ